MFFENFVGLIQLPVTLLNVPVSNILKFILGSKAERYKAKKKKRIEIDSEGRIIHFFFLLFPLASEPSIFKEIPCTNLNSHDQCSHAFINPWLLLVNKHMTATSHSKKPLGLFWLFRPSTAEITIRSTTTSVTFKYVVDKLEQSWATFHKEYCQNEGQKKPAGKK